MLSILTNSLPRTSMDSIVINELSSPKPLTRFLPSDRSYRTLNNRLRLKNEQLSKRQQSSCRIVFYSLWLCIIAGVITILIYRFSDECSMIINQKQFLIQCLRHELFLATIFVSFLACIGVIFGTCRYFRSQPRTSLYNNEHKLHLANNSNVLSITNNSCTHYSLKPLPNSASIKPSEQTQNHNNEHSNTTIISSITNISSQRKIPPFDYDELPLPLNSNINMSKNNGYSSTRNSYTTCVCGVEIWQKQQKS